MRIVLLGLPGDTRAIVEGAPTDGHGKNDDEAVGNLVRNNPEFFGVEVVRRPSFEALTPSPWRRELMGDHK